MRANKPEMLSVPPALLWEQGSHQASATLPMHA